MITQDPSVHLQRDLPDKNSASVYEQVCSRDVISYLNQLAAKSTGVMQKGIYSLLQKSQGYSCVDISKHFGVPSNSVRAWTSLAAKKLRQNQELYKILSE